MSCFRWFLTAVHIFLTDVEILLIFIRRWFRRRFLSFLEGPLWVMEDVKNDYF
jgi:hypothetical protein